MSARIATALTCDRCGAEGETRFRSRARNRAWMRANGWSRAFDRIDWIDLCPVCTAATPTRPTEETS